MNASIQDTICKMAREYKQDALLGTWAKTGRSEYTRCTGEVVKKSNRQWVTGKLAFQSAYAAMSFVDYEIKKGA